MNIHSIKSYKVEVKAKVEEGSYSLNLNLNLNLGLCEQSHYLHMVGLWEHINEAESLEMKSSFRKEAKVSRKGRGVTRDIDDLLWFQSDHLIQDSLAARPRRVEDNQIRFFPSPMF